jgi:hypothetical protein
MATKKKVKRSRGLLDVRKKATMMAVICRNPEVFEQVRPLLPLEDAETIGGCYAVVYKCVGDFYDEYFEMPGHTQLKDSAQQVIADNPDELTDDEVDRLDAFIDMIFDPEEWEGKDLATDPGFAKYARTTFAKFREERVAFRVSEQLLAGQRVSTTVADDLQDCLEAVQAAVSLRTGPAPVIFAEGWKSRERPHLVSTGLAALNEFVGGGLRRGELLLFMGPYGSMKTTVAVQGFVESAKLAQVMTESAANRDGPKVHYKAVFVSYEMPLEEFQERILCCLARIPRRRHKQIASYATDLRGGGEPYQYEVAIYAKQVAQGLAIQTEVERVRQAEVLLNNYAIFIDFSNADPNNPAGTGGDRELAAVMKSEKHAYQGVGDKKDYVLSYQSVWIDHLAAMIANQAGTDKIDVTDDTTRKLLKMSPKHIGAWVAKKHEVPVIILHQLAGDANSRSATAVFHHTDADECKSVGMFVDFAVQTGPLTKDDRHLAVWQCTKHRREPNRQRQIVQLQGDYNRVVSVDHKYTIEGARIVTWDESDSIMRPDQPKKKKRPGFGAPVPS